LGPIDSHRDDTLTIHDRLMRIALIADTHLSQRAPECLANWHAAARAVAAAAPDLTIHLGDITLDGEHQPEELPFAAALLRAWPTPMHRVLGNHDMGTASGEVPLSSQGHSRCLATFGLDHWCVTRHGWTLVGLNAQLFGTASTAEASQREWVHDLAQQLGPSDRVALFTHRPVRRPLRDDDMPTGRYVPADSARWLLEGPLRPALRLVASGHTHQGFDFVARGVRHLWVPSASFVISDALQRPVGVKMVGLGWLTLDESGCDYVPQVAPGARTHELTRLAVFRDTAHAR